MRFLRFSRDFEPTRKKLQTLKVIKHKGKMKVFIIDFWMENECKITDHFESLQLFPDDPNPLENLRNRIFASSSYCLKKLIEKYLFSRKLQPSKHFQKKSTRIGFQSGFL